MAQVVSALFRTRSSATLAVEDLIRRGFHQQDISMLLTDTLNGREFAMVKSSEDSNGAVIGAAILAPIFGIIAALSATGHLPAFSTALMAAGPTAALFAGIGLGGFIGMVAGALIGISMPKYEAKFFSFKPHSAGILVGAYVDDKSRQIEVRKVLEAAGGSQIGVWRVAASSQFRPREEIEREHAVIAQNRPEHGTGTEDTQ